MARIKRKGMEAKKSVPMHCYEPDLRSSISHHYEK